MIAGVALAALVLSGMATIIYWAFDQMVSSNAAVNHTNAVLAGANRARGSEREAYSTGSRFALTGAADQLAEHTRAVEELLRQVADLEALVEDNPEQVELLRGFGQRFETWRKHIAQAARAEHNPGTTSVAGPEPVSKELIRRSDSEATRSETAATWQAFVGSEQALLVSRSAAHERAVRWAKIATVGGPLLAIAFTMLTSLLQAFRLRRNIQKVTQAARDVAAGDRTRRATLPDVQEVRALALAFNDMAAALEEREREAASLHELVDLLGACRNLAEAGEAAAAVGQQLFPAGGGLFLANNATSSVELLVSWGVLPRGDFRSFHPDDCWALRRGQTVGASSGGPNTLQCRHLAERTEFLTMCVPLVAQGDALSLLQLCWPRATPRESPRPDLVHAFAEQLALALANVRLRERVLAQSLRDPLTGLFNRRYLDETLTRELARARRNEGPIGFLMIDVDHFKVFNDKHGHAAGDALLQALGSAMNANLRREDVACRYGGEEFLLILPGASLHDTQRRAEDLRVLVGRMAVADQGQALGAVSVSIGVATYPEHGSDGEVLIRAADAALYQAKHLGRNRIAVAGGPIADPGGADQRRTIS